MRNFLNNPDRPRIKLKLTIFDWITEGAAVVFLILLIGIPVYYFSDLPDIVPVHFNASGIPDGYGSRNSLLILPLTGIVMYILLTAITPFPHIFNFPVTITAENAHVQYMLATRLIRILKTVILVMFTFISWKTVQSATGKTEGLGKVFLPVFLVITFGVIIIYLVRSLNSKDI